MADEKEADFYIRKDGVALFSLSVPIEFAEDVSKLCKVLKLPKNRLLVGLTWHTIKELLKQCEEEGLLK